MTQPTTRRVKVIALTVALTALVFVFHQSPALSSKGDSGQSRQSAGDDLDFVISQLREQAAAQQASDGDIERAIRGLLNSPVPLNLAGKATEQLLQIGIGSYIVNGRGACAGCHTWNGVGTPAPQGSEWVAGGNPFLGQPEMINTVEFMSGGRPFGAMGAFASRNLTPDPANGLPGRPGMTEEEFIRVLRTGLDRRDQGLMQVMAWPMIRDLTDDDLKAIYAYLKEVPSVRKDIPDSPKVP